MSKLIPQLTLKGRSKNIAGRSKRYVDGALHQHLFKIGGEERTVRRQLNGFIKSKHLAYKWEVGDTIKKLRDRKHYFTALQLSNVMERKGMNKTVSDKAIHLDLIGKAHGVTAAEGYFVRLPETAKSIECYGSLLNIYCKKLMLKKAEEVMEKMKELGLPITAMSYNSLMTMYSKNNQHDKVPGLVQEMKASDITLQTFTYNVWMRALAAANDIYGVERVLEEMKRDAQVEEDWATYSNLASIYVEAGMTEKAESALKELENAIKEYERLNRKRYLEPYQFLITLYGRTGNLEEVNRVWSLVRRAYAKQTPNVAYLNMIQVLVNLKDLSGAEKRFAEWESDCKLYDIRVANALMMGYIKENLLEKATTLRRLACGRGAKPNAKTWEIFLDYHLKAKEFKKAINCVKCAVSVKTGSGKFWVPKSDVVDTLMEHFENSKDVNGAEAFIKNLKKVMEKLEVRVWESLIRTYEAAGKTSASLARCLKMENIEVSDACKKSLRPCG